MKNKNKVKFFGIFGKVFFYTCLILIFVVGVFFALFYERIQSTVTVTQQQQLSNVFQPLLESLQGKTDEQTIEIAQAFHAENRLFQFCLENADGSVLYQTDGFAKLEGGILPGGALFDAFFENGRYKFSFVDTKAGQKAATLALAINDKRFYVSGFALASSVFDEIVSEAIIAFFVILFFALIAAALFARRIAKPLCTLAANTRMMAELCDAPDFPRRSDEIGQLAKDVYLMHQNQKDVIEQLEEQIKREREMEENQRYFFSAASHELKTPIAAACAILEGMTECVIEQSEYPKYLRETLRLMNEQSELVTEILEIVKMNERMTTPVFEEINLLSLIDNALKRFWPLFEAKEQTLTLDINPKLTICSDPRLLSRALTSILQNATQNSPQKAKICISAENKAESSMLSIENGGAHIPEGHLPKMFEAFFIEDESRSKKKSRNGLGLTIVKKILDLLNVPFELQNTENGVLFFMTFPNPDFKARLD